jgi:D-alanine-D-alanine ligase
VAVLGNESPRASVPGEIVPGNEFYDYDDKYLTDGADLLIPAKLGDDEIAEVQRLAVAAYRALRVDGMARVDFFYEQSGPRRGWLVNELNTIPGFTPISMYPKLWEASGISYGELVDELVRLAIARFERRQGFSTAH